MLSWCSVHFGPILFAYRDTSLDYQASLTFFAKSDKSQHETSDRAPEIHSSNRLSKYEVKRQELSSSQTLVKPRVWLLPARGLTAHVACLCHTRLSTSRLSSTSLPRNSTISDKCSEVPTFRTWLGPAEDWSDGRRLRAGSEVLHPTRVELSELTEDHLRGDPGQRTRP